MAATLLFWLALLLPGYAVGRLIAPADLKGGLLGVLGSSSVWAFAVVSPVSMLAYGLRLPVAAVSAAYVMLVAAAIAQITRARWWGDLGKMLRAGVTVELLIILGDMVLGWRVGAFLGGGDERLHIARIRFLIDHGFSNLSPFPADPHFFPTYHTNLLHALHAACVHITGVDVLEEWYAGLVAAKLFVASAFYFLAWRLFECRWVAGLVAVFAVGWLAPLTFLVLPNKLAPFWLVPIMLGVALAAGRREFSWSVPITLGIGSVLLGQIHSLYAVFTGIALGPVLAALFLLRTARRMPSAWRTGACVAALFAGAPLAMTARGGQARPAQAADTPMQIEKTDAFHHYASGGAVYKPEFLKGAQGVVVMGLVVAGLVLSMAGERRKEVAILVAATLTVALVLFVPPVCAGAIKVFGQEWIVGRLGALLNVGMLLLAVGGVSASAKRVVRWWWLRSLLSVGAFLLGVQSAGEGDRFGWNWYYQRAKAPREARHATLDELYAVREFFRDHIPAGDTVLADPQSSMRLVMLHDCHSVALGRGGGVKDLAQRLADVGTIVGPSTPWETRRRLLRRYGITVCVVDTRFIPEEGLNWAYAHRRSEPARLGTYVLVKISTE